MARIGTAGETTSGRPPRLSLCDFCGQKLSLPSGGQSWEVWGRGPALLLLGLGPDAPQTLPFVQEASEVCWLEAPDVLQGMERARRAAGLPERSLPASWRQVDRAEAVALMAAALTPEKPLPETPLRTEVSPADALPGRGWRVAFYSYGRRLAPSFWGPLLGEAGALALEQSQPAKEQSGQEQLCSPAETAGTGQAGRTKKPEPPVPSDPHGLSVPQSQPAPHRQPDPQHQLELSAPGGPVLLPGDASQLLHQELRAALQDCGLGPVLDDVACLSAAGSMAELLAHWHQRLGRQRPVLLLSVNLRGLDAEGRLFALCRALQIPVAVWFVDTPWHLLSSLRLPWWREAHLFVTDMSFKAGLEAAGARHVTHLPLAVAPHMWQSGPQSPDAIAPGHTSPSQSPEAEHATAQVFSVRARSGQKTSAENPPGHCQPGHCQPQKGQCGQGPAAQAFPQGRPLFVGRLAFPGKARFFAAARVPQALAQEARALLQRSRGPADGPHFHWWQAQVGGACWPGHAVRTMGLGAEQCSLANRLRWVQAALPSGLLVVGDEGWRAHIMPERLLPPVDYYSSLPRYYAQAGAVLNVTSLLLPHSLSQRHFDVWAAGGLLLSDATPGLAIFPAELTRPMMLHSPQEFLSRWQYFQTHPQEARELREAWRTHLRQEHGYVQRIQSLCQALCRSLLRDQCAPPYAVRYVAESGTGGRGSVCSRGGSQT